MYFFFTYFIFREPFVESRIRKLIGDLERTINVKYAVPISEKYRNPDGKEHNTNFFLGLVTETGNANSGYPNNQVIDLSPPVANFLQMVKTYDMYKEENMGIEISWVPR